MHVEGREALQINTAEFNKAAKKHYNALTSADKQRLYMQDEASDTACMPRACTRACTNVKKAAIPENTKDCKHYIV